MTKWKRNKNIFPGLSVLCGIAVLSPVVIKPTLIANVPVLSKVAEKVSLNVGGKRCDFDQSPTEDKLFPERAIVNVKTQYNAKGDGITDDTQAIQKAIQENIGSNRVLYFPQGTYLVTERLSWQDNKGRWRAQLKLQGQNRANTIIQLQDNTPGYDNPSNPKALMYTASDLHVEQPHAGGKDYPGKGEGNEAFQNYIEDLTIDTGNNRGAIALDYLTNNIGAVRNVRLRGQGPIGLDMTRKWIGPALIKNLVVEGFDRGILIGNEVNGVTLEHITLCNQNIVGIENSGNVVAMRGIWSSNSVPAVSNSNIIGLVSLRDGDFEDGSSSTSAIVNNGRMLALNIRSDGYQSAIMQDNKVVPGDKVKEFTSSAPLTVLSSLKSALNSSVEEPPNFINTNLATWTNVEDYGARGNDWGDDTAAIQSAIDSGNSTVYIPPGQYYIGDTIRVRGNVRQIVAMGAVLSPGGTAFQDANNPKAFIRVEDGTSDDVTIESVDIKNITPDASPGLIGFEHATNRTLFLKDVSCCSWRGNDEKYMFKNTPGAGKLFIENVIGETWRFDNPQKVWARQLNPEGSQRSREKIVNKSGNLWILGLKVEGDNLETIIRTTGGGVTELFGALLYTNVGVSSNASAFINDNSFVSLSYATMNYSNNDYQIHVWEIQGSQNLQLTRNQGLWRGGGVSVPLYVGGF